MIDPLIARFEERYGRRPSLLVRSPGRVNLIGEHTDYSLLPVLPMAIDRATYVAAAPREDGRVRASSRVKEGDADVDRAALDAPVSAPWQRYLVGVLRELDGVSPELGADLLLDGDLPTSGGLSSSSSLSVGLTRALDAAWQAGLSDRDVLRRAIVAERHVGVEGGGMDQTVITLARANCALRIDFAPAAERTVPLPDGLAVVVAYSGAEAPKGGSAQRDYNQRVVACRLAAALLARALEVSEAARTIRGNDDALLLGDVARAAGNIDKLGHPADGLPEHASALEVAERVGCALDPLVALTAGRFPADEAVAVRAAARHVTSEAARVDAAESALYSGELDVFGTLLDVSHHSLALDYQCSTAALDRLCTAMIGAGALGARLTGAGFGGYAVAAVPPERVDAVIAAANNCTGGPAFAVRASDGARVETIEPRPADAHPATADAALADAQQHEKTTR